MRAMTLRLPDEVHEALRKEAYESRRSMNEIVLEALAGRELRKEYRAAWQGKLVETPYPGGEYAGGAFGAEVMPVNAAVRDGSK